MWRVGVNWVGRCDGCGMKPRLIFHIGTHKTGTTSLQSAMSLQSEALAAAGFCYPASGTTRTNVIKKTNPLLKKHLLLTTSAADPDESLFAAEHARLMQEFAASGQRTMVLSEEGLSGPGFLKHNGLARVQHFAGDFDIHIVCLVRRQDSFVESLWNQRCKMGKVQSHIDTYADSPLIREHMNYTVMLDRWASLGAVKVIGFEAAIKTGLEATFSAVTGIPLVPSKQRNVSPSMTCAAVMAVLSRMGYADVDWRQLQAALGPDGPKRALGSRLRQKLLADYAQVNDQLFTRYGVEFPQDMPDEPAEMLPVPTRQDVERMVDAMKLVKKPTGPAPAPGG